MESVPGPQQSVPQVSPTPSLNGQQPTQPFVQSLQVPQPFVVQLPSSPEKKRTWPDWVQLIVQVIGAVAVPLSVIGLIIGVQQFSVQQKADQQKTQQQDKANLQQQKDQFHNLQDQEQQATLDTYLDRMSDLLLTYHLAPKPSDEVRAVATVRTLTTLHTVDAHRKGIVIRFLWKAQLVNGQTPIISLKTADLAFANINSSYLYNINLSGALLSFADLNNCDLHNAILSDASVDNVDLRNSNLHNANLQKANMAHTQLSNTDITGALLKGTTMPDGTIHS